LVAAPYVEAAVLGEGERVVETWGGEYGGRREEGDGRREEGGGRRHEQKKRGEGEGGERKGNTNLQPSL
jgi:hypothetical protein